MDVKRRRARAIAIVLLSACVVPISYATTAEPSPYDSHPSPKNRFAMVHALDHGDGKGNLSDADQDAWQLLADREAIEQDMTSQTTPTRT